MWGCESIAIELSWAETDMSCTWNNMGMTFLLQKDDAGKY